MSQPPDYGPPPPGEWPPDRRREPGPHQPRSGPDPGHTGDGSASPYQHPLAPPPPPPRRRRTGLIIGIVIAAVLLSAAAVAAFLLLRDDDEEPAATETTAPRTAETTSPEATTTTGPPPIAEAVGRCLPQDPVLRDNAFDLSTPCDGDEAFWTVTAAGDSVEATVDEQGRLSDVQPAYDVCGAGYGRFTLGEPWTDWYFTYDSATRQVEELLCVEAIGNPDPQGRLPTMPATGDCFDDSDTWWTVPCDSDLAVYEVVDAIEFDEPRELSGAEAEEASSDCSGGEFFWQVTDRENRTTAILCGDER